METRLKFASEGDRVELDFYGGRFVGSVWVRMRDSSLLFSEFGIPMVFSHGEEVKLTESKTTIAGSPITTRIPIQVVTARKIKTIRTPITMR